MKAEEILSEHDQKVLSWLQELFSDHMKECLKYPDSPELYSRNLEKGENALCLALGMLMGRGKGLPLSIREAAFLFVYGDTNGRTGQVTL